MQGGRQYKMKTKLGMLAVALIAGGTMFAQTRLSVGIGIGAGGYGPGYYPPPAYAQYVPPCPGPDYAWVDGYWAPQGGRNVWIAGFWNRPFVSGYRVAPRYVEPRYDNSYRGNDRNYDRARGYENRGNQRNESRRQSSSNSFRR
jgi:WXXGXW repeat (2 copies)